MNKLQKFECVKIYLKDMMNLTSEYHVDERSKSIKNMFFYYNVTILIPVAQSLDIRHGYKK